MIVTKQDLVSEFISMFDKTPRKITQEDIESAFIQALQEYPGFEGDRKVVYSETLTRLYKQIDYMGAWQDKAIELHPDLNALDPTAAEPKEASHD